jgi:type I restriction enzyme S subunit
VNKLTKYKFSDLYEMNSGISSTPEQAGHGAPFCSFTTVFNNYFLPTHLPDLMDTSIDEQRIYSLKEGDILLTRTSETIDALGMSSVAISDYPHATFSGFLKRLRPLQNDITYHKYMAFYLRSPLFRKAMDNNAVMTLRCSLNEQIFSYLELLLPEYSQQKKIGDLLFAIYEKIELNNRINDELEGFAKLLYSYWFLQFDFPISSAQASAMGDNRLKGKPYRASGGPMAYNAALKLHIPIGWADQKIADMIESDKSGDWGQDKATGNYQTEVYCIRGTDLKSLNGIDSSSPPRRFILAKNSEKLLKPGEVVIEISGGGPDQSTGRASALTTPVFARFDKPLVCSNFCKAVTLKEDESVFYFYRLWSFLYECRFFFNWEGKTSGIKNLLFDSLANSKSVVKPDKVTLLAFDEVLNPLEEIKQKNLVQNGMLIELRDWLLPMLMSGQVTMG